MAIDSTHRLAVTKRASMATGGDLSDDEGILDLLALGNMPPGKATAVWENQQPTPISGNLALLIHDGKGAACDRLGGSAHA